MAQPRAGFSLIEIMIALAILAIALTAFCSSLGNAQQIEASTATQARVLEAMEKVVEDIQNTAFGQYTTAAFDVQGVVPRTGSKRVGSITWNGQTATTIPYQITAQWTDADGGTRTYQITYYHVNRGG